MARLHKPKSENKAKDRKDGRDSTNQSMVESTMKHCLQQTLQNQKCLLIQRKIKESTTNQTDAGQLKSETNVASNEADKSDRQR